MASTMGKTTTVGTTIAFVSMIGVNYFQVKGYFNDMAFIFFIFYMLKATIRFDFIVGNPREGSHIRFVFVGILADISLV